MHCKSRKELILQLKQFFFEMTHSPWHNAFDIEVSEDNHNFFSYGTMEDVMAKNISGVLVGVVGSVEVTVLVY